MLSQLALKVGQYKDIKNWPTDCLIFGVYSGKLAFKFSVGFCCFAGVMP